MCKHMGEKHTNRLIHEQSPYLLQHAHNPVEWYPWGEEAFLLARQEDKPIFLSIGYATCHWCHVMERESFNDEGVAQYLNEAFVNIKLDREERPEVDSLYMDFAQGMMSGSAGWPLNVVLTSNLEPIFSATYLPPKSRHGLMGVVDLAKHFVHVWGGQERVRLEDQAHKIVQVFKETQKRWGRYELRPAMLHRMVDLLYQFADPVYGGLKGAPKFPLAYHHNFLLRYAWLYQEARAVFFSSKTLQMMSQGGIRDHVGGGFSRYSVDERWEIPHFEKMLYDQSMIVLGYLEHFMLTKHEESKVLIEEVVDYVLRVLRTDEGGFCSAQDADSMGKEGVYYTWTREEMLKALSPDYAELILLYYHVRPEGNFYGRSVLHTPLKVEDFCRKYGLEPSDFQTQISHAKHALFQHRSLRPEPEKDDKILTSWNGLMIAALSQAGVVLGRKDFLEAAIACAHFILTNLVQWQEGNSLILQHRYRNAESAVPGVLEDYAFLIKGLLCLFEATGNAEYLGWAIDLEEVVEQQFARKEGGYFQAPQEASHLIFRKMHFTDGAEPSGNAIHGENLLRLAQMTNCQEYRDKAVGILESIGAQLQSHSPEYCYHLMNLMRLYDHQASTWCLAYQDESERHLVVEQLVQKYQPHQAIVAYTPDSVLVKKIPHLHSRPMIEEQTTLYPCTQNSCKAPVNGVNNILEYIRDV